MTEQITEGDPRYLVFVAMVERWEDGGRWGNFFFTNREITLLGSRCAAEVGNRAYLFDKDKAGLSSFSAGFWRFLMENEDSFPN